jgi:hypothetical protein
MDPVTEPASIHEVVLGLQLDNAVNIVALNWVLLTPQQKARVLSAIPREEWPE